MKYSAGWIYLSREPRLTRRKMMDDGKKLVSTSWYSMSTSTTRWLKSPYFMSKTQTFKAKNCCMTLVMPHSYRFYMSRKLPNFPQNVYSAWDINITYQISTLHSTVSKCEVLSLFFLRRRPDLITLYFHEPDYTAHRKGPDANQVRWHLFSPCTASSQAF